LEKLFFITGLLVFYSLVQFILFRKYLQKEKHKSLFKLPQRVFFVLLSGT